MIPKRIQHVEYPLALAMGKANRVMKRGCSASRALQPATPRRLPRGLSLLEVLVAIAIMLTLIILVVPGLRQARSESRRAACLANLHQVGLATHYYLDDNQGRFWRYHEPRPDGRRWWFGFEPGGPGSGAHRPLDKSQSVLAPYLRSMDDRLQCPAFPYEAGCYFPKFAARSASYGYNLRLGPPNPRVRVARRDRFQGNTSHVFVFADGAHFDHNPGMNEGVYIEYQADPRVLSGYGHFRHRGRAMVLYMDAHAEGQPLRGPAHPFQCSGPAGNLSSPQGGRRIYGPPVSD